MQQRQQICFEDVSVGMELGRLTKGPLGTPHLMRWSAAMENWHKIHYDKPFAIEHDKLPGLLINGSFKQQFMAQLVKDFAGPMGWPWKLSFQFRAMDVVGGTMNVWGRVTSTRRLPEYGLVELELGIVNEKGAESTPGKATVALPYRDGKPASYPFKPPQL